MEAAERQDSSAGKGASSSSSSGKNGTLLACAFLIVLLTLVFAKTIFASGSISRLCVLAEWDSVFDQWRTGRAQPYDPSLVQIFLPDYMYLAKNACRGILPMWNPNCGLGYPFIGDIQSSVFAPLRAVFDFAPGLRTYNFYLILELVVCAISTFFLCRSLLIRSGSARFASPTRTRSARTGPDYEASCGSPASEKLTGPISAVEKAGEPPALPGSKNLTGPISGGAKAGEPPALPGSGKYLLVNIAAVFGAVCYTFCPYNLWYLELNLGTSASLFPLTALAFVNAAEKKNYSSAVLAGVAAALLIVSGHPECSFFGIILSSALMFLLLFLEEGAAVLSKCWTALKILLVAALATVASAAPALFPFAEYLLNGQSYKYGSTYSTPVTWNGILFNLANPGQNGASPYLGVIAALLIPAAVFALANGWRERYRLSAVAILSAITFILVSQLGPVQEIFIKPPFTAIITRYALPYLLMLLSVLAGAGLFAVAELLASLRSTDELRALNSPSLPPWTQFFVFSISLVFAGILIFKGAHSAGADAAFMKVCDFDAMLPGTAFNAPAWRRDLICAASFFIAILSCGLMIRRMPLEIAPPRRHREGSGEKQPGMAALPPALLRSASLNAGVIVSVLALAFSLLSILSVAKQSLPQQSKFFYPETELIQKLKNDQFRTISTCEYVFRPATNCVYGINFLSVHNPLFPKRFFEFTKACGAETDMFNQKFNTKLSALLNLASIKYVLSMEPVSDSAESSSRFNLFYKAKNNIEIYVNTEAAPRAYLVHKSINSTGADDSLQKIQQANFDPSSTVVLESGASGRASQITGEPLKTRPRTESYESAGSIDCSNPNQVLIECNAKSAGWLVLTDIYYPGWNVYVDGKKENLERANYAFRAVHLEAGPHSIRFAYEPISLLLGICSVAMFTFLLACLTIAGLLKREI
jgi:hypothetical protein